MQQSRTARAWLASLTAAAAAAAFVIAAPPALAAPADKGADKIDQSVLDSAQQGEETPFFIVLTEKADLSGARKAKGHEKKAELAYTELTTTAANTQRPLRNFLDKNHVEYQPYWIANTIHATTADVELIEDLAARKDVAKIVPERTYALDDTIVSATAESATTAAAVAADTTVEWGISDIKADQVWSQYGVDGDGIVIANIDSGVQYDHPALVANYRGNLGNGTFSHDYNWYDPTGVCTGGVPCDNNNHGTHTMGTMVGAGGIGVAPGATWIAAKGCEGRSCSDPFLLDAGQWMLAPTDHNGQNPRPDLSPDIINNSWGGSDDQFFYADIIEAWNSAGIFEAFAAGNDGDGVTCSTTAAPGGRGEVYGVGAYDVNGKIASFSGFGPSPVDGSMRPDITAPGVNVRSTIPGNSYQSMNGTSMATPHLAGAVALLWSEAPSLIGDIPATQALLNQSARDVDDTHCGGTAGRNNVWGDGKLDILAAVDAAPHTRAIVTGTATDGVTGAAIANLSVHVTGAGFDRIVTTGADGGYRVVLPAGTFRFALSGYGYANLVEDGYVVSAGTDADHDFTLTAVPHHSVTGVVRDVVGAPLSGVTISLGSIPVPAVKTDAQGRYTLPSVAEGTFAITATPTAPVLCNGVANVPLVVAADVVEDIDLPARTDAAGTSCLPAKYSWIKGSTKVAISGDEDAATVKLPFAVDHYGTSYTTAAVTTNGMINFVAPRLGDYANSALPTAAAPNGIIAAFWDDLVIDKKASVQTATVGTAGKRQFAIVWNNAAVAADPSVRLSFEAVFDEASGTVTLQYKDVAGSPLERGASATIGIESGNGSDALQYSFNEAVVTDGSAISFIRKGH
ncbi:MULTISPECIES: S8 family serine peptidase [unclassified Microbacterium]|uniref:S8 family serine peptidase n=1 Tax=unclassified Microbacterium TaxID=2609290 RepID=UPI0012F7A9FF|nr:S8 family serine peptidase [Microbacterium sp. MAH-37]MVQ42273.1 S8 family serine peptidase [Microbacterium sp. MAH-37]